MIGGGGGGGASRRLSGGGGGVAVIWLLGLWGGGGGGIPPPGICIPGRFQRGSRRPPSSARLPGCPKPLFSARREPGVPQGRDELGGPRCGDPALHKVVSAGAVPAGHRGSRSLFPTVGRLVCRKAPSGLLLCAFVFLFFRFCRSSLKQ